MTKLGTPENYYVRVRFDGWNFPPEEEHLHEGCYFVDLNRALTVHFIDDLGSLGPPWVESALPPEEDGDLDDPALVRLLTLLQSVYAVTPNDDLAGRVDRFPRPWPTEDWAEGTVFYVTRAEFAVLLADIIALTDSDAGSQHSLVRRDALLGHPCVKFIEERVLTSPWLAPLDARSAGLGEGRTES